MSQSESKKISRFISFKWLRAFIVIALISILTTLGDYKIFINGIVPSILYVICFVLFFRGQSLLQSVDYSKIKHPFYLKKLTENNWYMKRSFSWLFVCTTIFFAIDKILDNLGLSIQFFDFRLFTVLTLLEAIFYYDLNSRNIIKLMDQISELTTE